MFRKILRALAFGLLFVGAVFGIPVVIDPPPRNTVVEVAKKDPQPPRI